MHRVLAAECSLVLLFLNWVYVGYESFEEAYFYFMVKLKTGLKMGRFSSYYCKSKSVSVCVCVHIPKLNVTFWNKFP